VGNARTIVDIHVHLFDRVDGRNADGPTVGAPFGRVATATGTLQFMPPFFRETSFSDDMILEMMDFTGVHKAVLLQNPLIGVVNEAIARAVRKHPDRFLGTIQGDPRDPMAANTIRRYASNPLHAILKLEMSDGWGWTGIHRGLTLDDDCFTPIWRAALDGGLPIVIDGGRPGNAGYQVDAIDRLTSRYSGLTFILEHLGALSRETFSLRERQRALIQIGKKKNVYLGIASLAAGLKESFPYRQSLELLKEGVEVAGAEKILWGSDIPGTLKHQTYAQMISFVSECAEYLSEADKDLILGGNALRVFPGFAAGRAE
jgi:predicted TIM-barrel fold metal-dependent hydrolase